MTTALLAILVVAFLLRGRRTKGGAADLTAALASAEAAGIITAVQREQIVAHAAATGATRARLGGAAWLGIFAGLFVAAGISLLIARNWESIGPSLRLGTFLLLLIGVGEAAIRARERALGISVSLEILWFLLPLFGIGLYGQTFQLSGDPIRPFLVWLALTAPLAWLSARPVVATLHTFALMLVLFAGNFVLEPLGLVLGGGPNEVSAGMLVLTGPTARTGAWLLSLVLLVLITLQSLRLLPRAHRHHCVGVWAIWLLTLLVAPTAVQLHHPGWIVLGWVALSTLWIVVLTAMETSLEERAMSLVVWLGTLYALTFTWHMADPATGGTTAGGLAIVGLAVAGALGGTLGLPSARLSPLPAWAAATKAMLILPLLVTPLYLQGEVHLVWMVASFMNVVLVVIAVGLMWHGSLVREPMQVNLGVLVLVGVLITRFLDVFGNMLRSGIGFIVAGVLLATLAWALERTRRRLIAAPSEVSR